MVMIDVHMLVMPGEREDWRDQCLASLENEPVTLHVVNGILDDIGNARAKAFMLGDSDYVAFVDPDDYVLPGGFNACLNQLRMTGAAAVYAPEIVTGFRGEVTACPRIKRWAHHMIVFERKAVEASLSILRDWRWEPPMKRSEVQELLAAIQASGRKVGSVDAPYYVWRRHIDSFISRKRRDD